MNESNSLRSKIIGIDHSIIILEKEKSKLENKLIKLSSDDKKSYEDKYSINYRKLTKGIPQSKKPNPEIGSIPNNLTYSEVGKLGEESYYKYLKEILDKDFCSIEWINEKEESKKPFDFTVKLGKATFYIDVKTTRGRKNNKIYLSPQELRFAKARKPNYLVARLSHWDDLRRFKAGHFNVTVMNLKEAMKLTKDK